jgi:hypothetical protein
MWSIKPAAHEDMMLLRPASSGGFASLAAAMAAAAYGCFKRRRWGRTLAVIILALNALGDAIHVIQSGAIEGALGVVIAGALVLWITRPRVKALFS